MTKNDIDKAADILRENGYVVVILSPRKLRGVDPRAVEAILNERALQAIQNLRNEG